jgi:hypothetical protein
MKVYLLVEDEPESDEFPSIVVSVHASYDSAYRALQEREDSNWEERGIDSEEEDSGVTLSIEEYEVEE